MSAIVSDTPQEHNTNGKNAVIMPANMAGQFETHFLMAPIMQAEIKNEPPEDIDDTPHNLHEGGQAMNGDGGALLERKPTITLTPTMKLLASPNPVDPKRKFPCPYENCTKSYGKSSHLRSHLTWHTGIKPYVCQELNCGKSFTRSDELNRHSRTHTGEKPFECMQCAKKFSRSDHLTKHVATHTKQMQTLKPRAARPPPSAEKPDSPPAPKKALTELTEMSLPQQGMNYDDGMHFMASLLECAQFKHGRHVLETENVNVEPPLMTKHMPIKIKLERPDNSDQYKVVNAATDDENTTLEEEEEMVMPVATVVRSTPTPSPPPHTTALVNTQAQPLLNAADNDDDDFDEGDGDGEYTTDDDIVMPDANAPPLPLAGAPFAVPRFGFFEDDLDGIDPERPYQCSQCAKCFKRQDDLNRHLRTHTGEKPFACEDCDKRFMRSDHLKKHMKTHSKHR